MDYRARHRARHRLRVAHRAGVRGWATVAKRHADTNTARRRFSGRGASYEPVVSPDRRRARRPRCRGSGAGRGKRASQSLPAEKIEHARDLAVEVVRARDGVRFDRAHFKAYGAYSLDYEIVYYVLSSDYNTYMDHQHAINLALYTKFEAAGIP